jgi:hypothetical protein
MAMTEVGTDLLCDGVSTEERRMKKACRERFSLVREVPPDSRTIANQQQGRHSQQGDATTVVRLDTSPRSALVSVTSEADAEGVWKRRTTFATALVKGTRGDHARCVTRVST